MSDPVLSMMDSVGRPDFKYTTLQVLSLARLYVVPLGCAYNNNKKT
jgi:hypothetical protein